jgi:hypothetical protein
MCLALLYRASVNQQDGSEEKQQRRHAINVRNKIRSPDDVQRIGEPQPRPGLKNATQKEKKTYVFLARQLLRCASQGMEQYVELGRSRIHLSQEAQRTRYASNCATCASARRYSMRSSSVRFARRRFAGGVSIGCGANTSE